MASCAVTVTPAILNSTAAAASVKGVSSSHTKRQSGQRRGARAAQLRCKPVNVYPVPPTRGVPGSAVPITIELATTVRASAVGGRFVLVGVPVDVNLPANVIVHTPMYPVNVTPLYVATPEAALMTAFGDSTQAAGATVAVTVMASCAVTTFPLILNTTAATASVEGIASIRRTRSAAPNL